MVQIYGHAARSSSSQSIRQTAEEEEEGFQSRLSPPSQKDSHKRRGGRRRRRSHSSSLFASLSCFPPSGPLSCCMQKDGTPHPTLLPHQPQCVRRAFFVPFLSPFLITFLGTKNGSKNVRFFLLFKGTFFVNYP